MQVCEQHRGHNCNEAESGLNECVKCTISVGAAAEEHAAEPAKKATSAAASHDGEESEKEYMLEEESSNDEALQKQLLKIKNIDPVI